MFSGLMPGMVTPFDERGEVDVGTFPEGHHGRALARIPPSGPDPRATTGLVWELAFRREFRAES